jgi:hypothetical protein
VAAAIAIMLLAGEEAVWADCTPATADGCPDMMTVAPIQFDAGAGAYTVLTWRLAKSLFGPI